MSNSIDKRVVEMGFDNRQFETGVQTSIKSLDNLKKGLNLDASAKSLTNLSNAGKSFSLNGISDGVKSISDRFSAMGIIGMAALVNLTNSAFQLGKNLVVVATGINDIRSGFAEYESSINAFQTIMANVKSSGASIEDVNDALKKLNVYANQTIFSYGDMTKAAGLFTAQGVNLKDSIAGIKGIFNIIALTGGDAQKANGAIYQLSQAIASGTVRAQDWISVINAGIGGTDFQNQLIQTARVHGVAVDRMIKKEGSFRESLQTGWLSSKILLETLQQYTGDLSAETLKSMGYTEAQIKQIQELGTRANDSATKLKTFTQMFEMLKSNTVTNWATSWKILVGDLAESTDLWTYIGNAIGGFSQKIADSRNTLLGAFKDMGGRTAIFYALKSGLDAVIKVIDIFRTSWEMIFPPTTSEQIFSFVAAFVKIGDLLKINSETANKLGLIFKGVASIFDIGRMAIEGIIKVLGTLFNKVMPSSTSILDFIVNIAVWITNLRNAIKYTDFFGTAIGKLRTFFSPVITVFNNVVSWMTAFIGKAKEIASAVQLNIGNAIGGIARFLDPVVEWFGKVIVALRPLADVIRGYLAKAFGSIKFDKFNDGAEKMKSIFEPMGEVFKTIGNVLQWFGRVFQGLAPVFSAIWGAISKGLSSIGDSILKAIQNIDIQGIMDVLNKGLLSSFLLAITEFVKKGSSALNGGLLAGLLLSIKTFIDKGAGTFTGIKGILDTVQGSLKSLQDNIKAKTLTTIAIAIAILAASLIALTFVDSGKLTVALAGVTAMFVELIGALAVIDKIPKKGNFAGISAGMIAISVSVLILSAAVANLARIDQDKLIQGLIGVGVILTELAAFMKVTDLSGGGILKSIGIVLLAAALTIMAGAVEKLGKIDLGTLEQGLIAMGVIMGEVTVFSRFSGNVLASAVALAVMGASMLVFSKVVSTMGSMSLESLAKGLGAIALAYLAIAGAANLMPSNMIMTAISLTIISASLTVLSKALSEMGGMSWESIGKGILVLASSLTILALAMQAMKTGIAGAAAMVVMSAALMIFVPVLKTLGSMSLLEIATGVGALAAAFLVIGVAGLVLGPLVPVLIGLAGAMALFGLACISVGAGVALFSAGLTALAISGAAGAAAIVGFVSILLGLIPTIAAAIGNGIVQFANAITAGAPAIGAAVLALIQNLLSVAATAIPQLISVALLLITTLVTALAANMPTIIQAGFDLLMALLNGVLNNIGQVVTTVTNIIVTFINSVASNLPRIIQAGWNLILSFINGLTNSVKTNLPAVIEACTKLGTAIVEGIAQGVRNSASRLISALVQVAKDAWQAAKDYLGINSPSKLFMKIGEGISEGWAEGVSKGSYLITNSVDDAASESFKAMSGSIEKLSDALNDQMDVQPTITPVVDLTKVLSSGKTIEGIFGDKKIEIGASVKRFDEVSSQMSASTFSKNGTVQNGSSSSTSFSFTQNNYSPKELSRLEIYRQTRNQLSQLKGLVNAT